MEVFIVTASNRVGSQTNLIGVCSKLKRAKRLQKMATQELGGNCVVTIEKVPLDKGSSTMPVIGRKQKEELPF